MPIGVRIDSVLRIVFATPQGTFTPEDLLGYQREVWSRPEVKGFNELVDMRAVERVEYGSPWKVREMAAAAVEMDEPALPTNLAIVAESDHLFGLARMYQTFREVNPKSVKVVQSFRSLDEALTWLESGS